VSTLVGGLGISHTPSMGVEYDRAEAPGVAGNPAWQAWFDGTRLIRDALASLEADHLVVVYNDHLNYFSLDNLPTLAIGIGDRFAQADEGWGPRPVADLGGDAAWGIHLAEQLVAQGFDPQLCLTLEVDHGIYSWFPYLFDQPWPVPITPIAVNMVCQPVPTSARMVQLGRALRVAIDRYPADARVVVVATGGMSHQISGARFGIANEQLDRTFLDLLPGHFDELAAVPVDELMRFGGTEAAELILWYAMRAALSDDVRVVQAFQTFPAITGCGALVLAEPVAAA